MFGFNGVFNRKPRQFEYKPLYYDPEKEARDKRRAELGLEPRDGDAAAERKPGDLLRSRLDISRAELSESNRRRRSSVAKLFFGIAILLGLLVWLIMSI